MNNYIKLPSESVIQQNDIIYVSHINKVGDIRCYYTIKITWANKVTEVLKYDYIEDAKEDYSIIMSKLGIENTKESEIIFD